MRLETAFLYLSYMIFFVIFFVISSGRTFLSGTGLGGGATMSLQDYGRNQTVCIEIATISIGRT